MKSTIHHINHYPADKYWGNQLLYPLDNRPFALRSHVTSFLWKWTLYDFAFQKRLVIHILNKIIVIWFFKPAPFSWNEYVRSWSRDQNVIFKIMNYFFLNTSFALKLQGGCWKNDVVTFTAHLSVTIKRLTRYKQKLVLAAMLEGKSICPPTWRPIQIILLCWKIKVP